MGTPLLKPRTVRDKRFTLKRPLLPSVLGKGREGIVLKEELSALWKGKKSTLSVAIKYPTKIGKPHGDPKYHDEFSSEKEYRTRLVNNRRIWKILKEAGVPVPKMFLPILRKKSPLYLATIEEDLSKTYGPLIKVHESRQGKPVFLSNLRVEKDLPLIKDLGKDLATIHGLGLFPRFADFWDLYKIPGTNTYGRIIVDVRHLHEGKKKPKVHINDILDSIHREMGWKEYVYFLGSYRAQLRELGKEDFINKIHSTSSQ